MKKILSVILTVAMLATMLTAFSVFVSADVAEGLSLEAQYAANDMADSYAIYTAADWAYFFNNRGDFSATTITVENDIDLNPGWEAKRVVTTETNTTPAGPGADGVAGTDDDTPEVTTSVTKYSVDKTGLTTELKIPAKVELKNATVDGKGHTVKGVYVEGVGGNEGAGLIGRMVSTTLKNIRFENCATINPKEDGTIANRTGGIATIASGTTAFENVYADILVTGTAMTGGFTALNLNADTVSVSYTNCVSVCDVLGDGLGVGGFVGSSWDRSASTFTNCGFFGKVTAVESTGGSDPRAAGMFVGYTSAGTSSAAAKAMLNSRVTLSNCIGAGEVVSNREWNGALIGYTYFHSTADTTDPVTGEVLTWKSNINATNSNGKTQYINLALTNCIYAGDFTKAVGDNKDNANILGTAATFGCDAKYTKNETAVVKVEANTLTGANAVLAVAGSFDLTTDWVAVADSFPMPKTLAAPVVDGGAGDAGDAGDAGNTGNAGNNDTTNSGNTNTNDTTTTAAPETEAPAAEKKGCGSSIGLAGIALVAAVATVGVVSKKRED